MAKHVMEMSPIMTKVMECKEIDIQEASEGTKLGENCMKDKTEHGQLGGEKFNKHFLYTQVISVHVSKFSKRKPAGALNQGSDLNQKMKSTKNKNCTNYTN
jgi:hypothetical protein